MTKSVNDQTLFTITDKNSICVFEALEFVCAFLYLHLKPQDDFCSDPSFFPERKIELF